MSLRKIVQIVVQFVAIQTEGFMRLVVAWTSYYAINQRAEQRSQSALDQREDITSAQLFLQDLMSIDCRIVGLSDCGDGASSGNQSL